MINYQNIWEDRAPQKPGGHILDRKNRTNNFQDMAPVTKSALTKLIL
jgi:hypothetical protein